jgi:hypothetical protein
MNPDTFGNVTHDKDDKWELGIGANVCNLSIWSLKQEEHEIKARLGYTVRLRREREKENGREDESNQISSK